MKRKGCSVLGRHVIMLLLLLLLCILFDETRSALPSSHHQQFSIYNREWMYRRMVVETNNIAAEYYDGVAEFMNLANSQPITQSSGGRRMMTNLKPNGDIDASPSTSRPGGGDGGHGRRLMSIYNPNGAIDTPPSRSRRGGGGHGRRLMSKYRPHGDIYTRPSSSGHGGGRIHQNSSP